MKVPFIALILQGIPEEIALVTLAFVIAKIPLEWKKIVPGGVVLAIAAYILRLLPITFGIHTIIILGLLFLFLVKFGKGAFDTSLIASLISVLVLIVTETVCLSLLMPFFGVTPEMLFTNVAVRILITLPQVFLLFIFAFIVTKIRNKRGS